MRQRSGINAGDKNNAAISGNPTDLSSLQDVIGSNLRLGCIVFACGDQKVMAKQPDLFERIPFSYGEALKLKNESEIGNNKTMWSYILKGAEGKSSMITMETLPSDMAKIMPTLKIFFFTASIGFVSGYSRMLLIGFHPILQGALLGLAIGTICGKTLMVGNQVPKNKYFISLISVCIGVTTLVVHYCALGCAIPKSNLSFVMLSWIADDMRELPQYIPLLGIGTMQTSISRTLWLMSAVADAIVLVGMVMFSLPKAVIAQKKLKKPQSARSTYRIFLLVMALFGSAFVTQRNEVQPNIRKIGTWTDEVWSKTYLDHIYALENSLSLPATDPDRIKLEEVLEKSRAMDREFPEAYYLSALEELSLGNFYLARDELARAIHATEQMTRRTWLEDGTPIHRDMLLAQLYQLRAKMALMKRSYLAAERDLTVAIMIHQDFWLETPASLNKGFFKQEAALLTKAGYDAVFGFGACHYERYIARKDIDATQAQEDLKEAISLGYPVSEEVMGSI